VHSPHRTTPSIVHASSVHTANIAAFVYAGLYQQFGARNSASWVVVSDQVRCEMALTVCGRRQLTVARCVLSTLSVRLQASLSSCHRAQHTGLICHSQLLFANLVLYSYRLQISACRVVVQNGVFCGTEAGAATTEKGPLSGIKVLDLTRSENESVRYIIQMQFILKCI